MKYHIAVVSLSLLFAAAATAAAPVDATKVEPNTEISTAAKPQRAVEYTYLKSLPGERENLKRYIKANWFAMDKIAVREKLMASYTLLETETDEGAWDVVVAVTYLDKRGYDAVVEPFNRIRKAHQSVLIDGKGLMGLGKIVESKRLFEDIPS